MTYQQHWKEMFDAWRALHPESRPPAIRRAARGCWGKVQHRTLEIAQTVADIANPKLKPLSGKVGPYECPVCGMFHIGHINEDGYGPDGRIDA